MNYRIASAWPLGRALTGVLAAAGLFVAAISVGAPAVFAQAQPPANGPRPAARPPATRPPAAKPQQQPAQSAQPAQAAPPAQNVPQLMYSSWVKICGKGQDTNNKEVCVVTKDGRLENGVPVAIVQLFEPEGAQKVLRVTVPLGMQLQHGTRIVVDQDQPMQSPYKICFPVGCMSDYPASDDLVNKLKKGQAITIQAINMQGTAISLPMPLKDFARALDGPPTDPKVFQEQQQKLQEELQKKADEARQKLQGQQGQAAPATGVKQP